MPTGATSTTSPPTSNKPAAASPTADSDALRAHLGRLAGRGFATASVARRLSAIRQLYRFLYSEGHRGDDPAGGDRRAEARPRLPEGAHHQAGRQPAGAGPRQHDGGGKIRAAARGAAQLPARGALRHRAARLRTRRAAGGGGAARPAHAGDPRQGRPRAAGSAQRPGQAHHDRLSGAPRRGASSTNPNGCSPPSARAATSAASISPAS